MFGDWYARVIQLKRQKKQPSVPTVVTGAEAGGSNPLIQTRIALQNQFFRVFFPEHLTVNNV
jgi:hypothetical protein